jgi:two-component system phosphate regulon response regulator OmpR
MTDADPQTQSASPPQAGPRSDADLPEAVPRPPAEAEAEAAGPILSPEASEAHLLIVDDDQRIRVLLQKFLMRHGFLVSAARDAAQARRLLAGLDFDLIVLDVMMPGEDGLALTADLRTRIATPILLLTAKGETGDRIAGLEAGADDYLPKPFEPKELLLRINAILRRVPAEAKGPAGPKVLHLGPVRYDIEKGEMWRGDEPVRLTATESALMRIFSARPGEPLSRAQLVSDLGRAGDQAQERAVDVQITRLRRKIEEDPRQPRYLQTVRGAGYMLAPE